MKNIIRIIAVVCALVVIGIALFLKYGPRHEAPEMTYGLADVQAASTTARCWVAIGSSVYDFSHYVVEVPSVTSLCGTDATDDVAKLGSDPSATFAALRIGRFSR